MLSKSFVQFQFFSNFAFSKTENGSWVWFTLSRNSLYPDSLYRDLSFHDIQFFPLQEEIINTVWQCREFSKIRSNRSMCFSFYSVEPVQGKMIIYVHNKYICKKIFSSIKYITSANRSSKEA